MTDAEKIALLVNALEAAPTPGRGRTMDFYRAFVSWNNTVARPAIDAAKVGSTPDATPDLLEALQEVMGWIGNWDPNFVQDDEWPDTSARVSAAIAKATGATP